MVLRFEELLLGWWETEGMLNPCWYTCQVKEARLRAGQDLLRFGLMCRVILGAQMSTAKYSLGRYSCSSATARAVEMAYLSR